MKKRIAICLSGQDRLFYLFSTLYSNLNKIYPEFQFDIFTATWESEGSSLSSYDFITESKTYKDTLPNYYSDGILNNFVRQAFLLKQSSLIREEYEHQNKFYYDAVIWTRIDVLIFPVTFRALFELLNTPKKAKIKISDVLLFNDVGIQAINTGPEEVPELYTNDRLFIGSSKSISKLSRLYDEYFNPLPAQSEANPHIETAKFILNQGIGLRNHPKIKYKIVRPSPWKGPVPPAKAKESIVKKLMEEDEILEMYRTFDNTLFPDKTNHPLEVK